MALQFSTAVRNALLDAMETATGTAPTLTIRTGAPPANCAAARAGTVLATIVLPSDWMAAASAGAKAIAGGPWLDALADATGVAGHFSIDQGVTCHLQGTITMPGGGGDMILINTSLAVNQPFEVTAFTITAGGA